MNRHFKIFGVCFLIFFATSLVWAGNIVSPNQYAWSDNIGWLNFGDPVGNVTVASTTLSGYATTQVDIIDLNCGDFNLCSSSSYKIARDSNGNLSGWAWNDNIGWVSFNCSDPGVCGQSGYKVYIDNQGYFHGWAWNDNIGWISFNCADTSFGCTNSNYKVQTNYISYSAGNLISNTFDTSYPNGVSFNTIMWKGSLNNGAVQLQFAASNCSNGASNPPGCTSGSWSYIGPDGTANTFYSPSGPGIPIRLNASYYLNMRYYRYKIFLTPSSDNTQTPAVQDVIINYSP